MNERGNNTNQSVCALLKELTEFCQSDLLSEDGLHEIIERHGCAPNNDDPNINYEFFHEACRNEKVTEGILRCLLEYFPNAAKNTDGCVFNGEENVGGCTPLHIICRDNSHVTLNIVELLIDAYPDSLRHEDNKGFTPLHKLCRNEDLDDKEVGLKILKLLLEKGPESARHATITAGVLPIHIAAAYQTPKFCRILIEAYPTSERLAMSVGVLPFHVACQYNNVAIAEYLYQLYPESIHVADIGGNHPIHHAFIGLKERNSHESSIELVQFLLGCNPGVVLQKRQNKLPLYWVCTEATDENTPKLIAYLKVLHILYDAYPDAIESNEVTSNVDNFCQEVQTFIDIQLSFARQARDRTIMTTRDENGQLALHKALRENITLGSTKIITLGSIKLLVKGNPSAVRCADNRGMLPLHVACQHHDLASVVDYLIDLDSTSLRAGDSDDNTALHHACCCVRYDTIALLLGKYCGVSVSKRNAQKKLPIDLLLQNKNEVNLIERTRYIDSIFQLIRAYPEIVMRAQSQSEKKASSI
jgi:ankyrin repeat protein